MCPNKDDTDKCEWHSDSVPEPKCEKKVVKEKVAEEFTSGPVPYAGNSDRSMAPVNF